jgi:hypothetical protein
VVNEGYFPQPKMVEKVGALRGGTDFERIPPKMNKV